MMDEKAELAALQAELADLEGEIVVIEHRLSDIRAQQRAIEERAMVAIRAGNDFAARSAILEVVPHAEAAAELEADLKVVRAMADACRWFLDSER